MAQAKEKEQNAHEENGGAEPAETIWVMSNRKDDRVVLWERDPQHPGGEAFVGGSTPDHVARTGEVERLLHQGLLIEIPEPPDEVAGKRNRKKPVPVEAVPQAQHAAAQPGQIIPLGRRLDPDLVPEAAAKQVEKKQAGLPKQVAAPAGAITPPAPQPERTTTRS